MTAHTIAADVSTAPRRSIARVAGASLAGTTLEFYDHFIYGSAAALVFPKLFFPQADPLTSTLLSLASYGVAFVARPFGAAIFGHYGDKIGRKQILIITLLMMGIATFAIGLMRCTGASLGFQFAGVFGGALAPLIATGLVAAYGTSIPVSLYLAGVLVLMVIAVFAARETSRVDLRDVTADS